MKAVIRYIKSRLSMKKTGKTFYDKVQNHTVYFWTDCYGDTYMAFNKFGFRVIID